MTEISSVYAEFINEISYDKLPNETTRQAKQQILDSIGVTLAGYKLMEFPKLVVDYVSSLEGKAEATVINTKKKFPGINAVLANAVCAHALDMDDGHRFAALHPGAVIIPTAIAATELAKASSKVLISGVVVGYEIMIRIGMAIADSSIRRGFHLTGITGTFGAAATTAHILGLTKRDTIHALGMAGLQSAGLLRVNHEDQGSKVKPLNPGKAAMAGFLSGVFAAKGAPGPVSIFEGDDGFLKAVADEAKESLLLADLGRKFEINNVYNKFYAACRHSHSAIEAALECQTMNSINTQQIKDISVETYPAAIKLAGIINPSTPSAGRFSIPFSVALVLVKGDADADKYSEENIQDEVIKELAQRVKMFVSKKWENLYPNKRGATITITDVNNNKWTAEVDLAKGEPEKRANEDDIYRKFYTNATMLISPNDANVLGETIRNLEDMRINDVVTLI